MAKQCYHLGLNDLGDSLALGLADVCEDNLRWYSSLPADKRKRVSVEMQPRQNWGLIQNLWLDTRGQRGVSVESGKVGTNVSVNAQLEAILQQYQHLIER